MDKKQNQDTNSLYGEGESHYGNHRRLASYMIHLDRIGSG